MGLQSSAYAVWTSGGVGGDVAVATARRTGMNPDELSKNPVLTDWDVKVIPI